jgi:hypothetical protein
MRNRIFKEQTENNMETVISNMIKFNNYVSGLSDEQKREILNNPKIESSKGGSLYDKALQFLNDYKDSAITNDGKSYLNSNDQKATNAFREFQNNLIGIFPSVYNADFQPVVMDIVNSGDTPEEVEAPTTPSKTDTEEPSEQAPEKAPEQPSAKPSEQAPEQPSEQPSETPSSDSGLKDAELAADKRLNNLFKKYMGGEYDPASALDRGKNEVLKSALKDFYDTNNKRFDINNPEDVKKFQPIINKAYTSPNYKNAATLGRSVNGASAPASKPASTTPTTSDQTPKYQVPASIKFGKDTLPSYVDMGGGKYRPATEEDISNQKTQLYIKNPRKGRGEYNKPEYVQVRREGNSDFRPQSKMKGPAGSVSNFAGDVGTSVKNFFSGGRKPEDSESELDNEQSPTADRPPARIQSR